ncbi:hypothetical protein, partial [Chryseobacterium sp. RR2-3-20]|uniref:hypothetical protein n=1 Tax=Chryseobacterium sp. RR2-3-20 TaxID=2787626 RepID=UPI001AE0D668
RYRQFFHATTKKKKVMKRYFLFFIIIFQTTALFGQISNTKKDGIDCKNELNEGNTLAESNIKGKVLSYKSTVHEVVSNSDKLIYKTDLKRNHVHETFFFDNNGNVQEVMAQYLYQTNSPIEDQLIKRVYKFDSNGKKIEEATYSIKDTINTLLRKEIYVFDSFGSKNEVIKYEKNDIKTRVIRKKEKNAVIEYQYDSNGKLLDDFISLKYDNRGNEIERINLNSKTKKAKSIEIKNYNSNNNEISYSYEGPIGKFKCEKKFDLNNNIIEKKCTSKSGTKYDRYDYVYDNYCNWIQKIETIDGKLDNVTLRVYEYR